MLALFAFLPILATLILMMVFNWPAKRCLLLSWALALVFGVLNGLIEFDKNHFRLL